MVEPLAHSIAIVDRAVQVAADRGDGVGHSDLFRRLQVLGDPPAVRTKEQAAINLAHEVWRAFLAEGLVSGVAERMFAKLPECRREARLSDDSDPWLGIEHERFQARKRVVVAELSPSISAAIRACRRYEQTRKPGHLREAVRILESAAKAERDRLQPELSADRCDAETACLGEALAEPSEVRVSLLCSPGARRHRPGFGGAPRS